MVAENESEIEALRDQLNEVIEGIHHTLCYSILTMIKITQQQEENAQLKNKNAQLKVNKNALIDEKYTAMKHFDHLFIVSSLYLILVVLFFPSLYSLLLPSLGFL